MKNRNILLLIILVSNFSYTIAQIPSVDYLKNVLGKVDSVSVSTIHYNEAEIVQPFAEEDSFVDTRIYTIDSRALSKNEIKEFTDKLNKSERKVVLSGHYDIEFNYYENDSVISIIRISSMMKSISIQNTKAQCENPDDLWETECYFLGSISKQLQSYLEKLLRRKGLWNKQQSFYNW